MGSIRLVNSGAVKAEKESGLCSKGTAHVEEKERVCNGATHGSSREMRCHTRIRPGNARWGRAQNGEGSATRSHARNVVGGARRGRAQNEGPTECGISVRQRGRTPNEPERER